MRTIGSDERPARGCMILSLLICVAALSAANSAQSQTPSQNQTSAYAEAGLSDPRTASPTVQGGAAVAAPSGTAVPLARVLSRTRPQEKAPGTAETVSPAGVPSRPSVALNNPLSQELWSNRMAAIETTEDAETSLALRHLIRQVRSVKFNDKDTGPTFTPPAEPQATAGEMEMLPVQANTAQPAASGTAPTEASTAPEGSTPLSTKAQQTLEVLRQNPGQVREPLEMAELLFLSGRPTEAAPFYARALDRISRIDPSYDADRAWILFQLGNCLRETDTVKAQDVYMKLVSEYPDSPWTELAKAHGRLLTWYQKSRPGQAAMSSQL